MQRQLHARAEWVLAQESYRLEFKFWGLHVSPKSLSAQVTCPACDVTRKNRHLVTWGVPLFGQQGEFRTLSLEIFS